MALLSEQPTCPDCGAAMVVSSPIEGGPDRWACPVCWGDFDRRPPEPPEAA